jgi:hypothetical protein
VIARVNGETLILGSSEAGISLLNGTGMTGITSTVGYMQHSVPPTPIPPAVMSPGNDGPTADFAAFDDEPADEGGMLSRLFRKKSEVELEEPVSAEGWRDFDDLLSESLEDQELRRRLANGVGTKVS